MALPGALPNLVVVANVYAGRSASALVGNRLQIEVLVITELFRVPTNHARIVT